MKEYPQWYGTCGRGLQPGLYSLNACLGLSIKSTLDQALCEYTLRFSILGYTPEGGHYRRS